MFERISGIRVAHGGIWGQKEAREALKIILILPPVKGISNIRLLEPRFGFDKSLETLTRVRQGERKYLQPNILSIT